MAAKKTGSAAQKPRPVSPDARSDVPLTEKQVAILDYIRSHILSGRPAPTVRQIGTEFGINSPNGVMGHLHALEKKGYILRDTHKSRCITLPGPTPMDVLNQVRECLPENMRAGRDVKVTLPASTVESLLQLTD